MKSLFSFRKALIVGFFAMMFSTVAIADPQIEPTWSKRA